MDLASCYSERWVDYPQKKGVKFLLRYYPESLRLSLQDKHTTIKPGGKKEVDYVAFGIDAINHMLRDWKGVKFHGKPAKCTAKNRQILITRDVNVNSFIAITSQIEQVFQDRNEDVLKNLKGLLSIGDNGVKEKAETAVE